MPSFVGFVVLDVIWIKFCAARMYQKHLKPVLKEPVDPVAALCSWAFIVVGNYLFAASRARSMHLPGAVQEALAMGATYGFVAYGIYDFTNTATISGWSWTLAAVDMLWGTVGSAIICLLQVWLKSVV